MLIASWSPDISSFYCPDIDLYLTGYAWCELCNKWWLLYENDFRSLTLEKKHYCSYYSRQGDRWQLKKGN